MSQRLKDGFPRLPLFLIVAVTLLLVLFIVQSYLLAMRMVERYTPLIDAAMEIKLEATTANLGFEEMMRGDTRTDIEQVRSHLREAIWYSEAMLEGGRNEEGRFIPLDDQRLRRHIENVRESLSLFSMLLEARWQQRMGDGTEHGDAPSFDAVFKTFISESDLVESRLQQLTNRAMHNFKRVQLLLLMLTGMIASGLVFSLARYHRNRQQQLRVMANVNHELRKEMALRKQVEKVLEHQATTDMMTGIANRHHMSHLLEQEVARNSRYQEPFSLLMFDIDHFKQINDRYGHDVGDDVLKEVALRGQKVLRESDTLARWGGEEFLILLPATELVGAHELAERCRESIADVPFATVGHVTASFGVAQYMEGETVRTLLRRIDMALYRSKAAGRNSVKLARGH